MKKPNNFNYGKLEDNFSTQFENELQKEIANTEQRQINHENAAKTLADIDNLIEENDDLKNRLLMSALIFE